MSVWSFAAILLRRRRFVLGLPLAAGVLAVVLSLASSRYYEASASFVPQDQATPAGGLGQLAAQFGVASSRTTTNSPQFYADLLVSKEILREVLLTRYQVSGSVRLDGNLLTYFGVSPDSGDWSVGRGLPKLDKAIDVTTNRATGIVTFTVMTKSPELSTRIARRLLDLLNDYNLRRRQSQARAEREFVQQRLEEARRELTGAEDAVAAFYRRNRRYQDAPELEAEEARLQRRVTIQQQLFMTLTQSFETSKIEEVRNTPVVTVIARPEGFAEKKRRGTIGKAAAAATIGLFAAVLVAVAGEYLERAGAARDADFVEASTLWRSAVASLRRRRASRAG